METVRLNGVHKIGEAAIPYIFTKSNNAFKLLVGNNENNLTMNFAINTTKITVHLFDERLNGYSTEKGTVLFTILDVGFLKYIDTAKEAAVIDVLGFYLAKILTLLCSGLIMQQYNNFIFPSSISANKVNGITVSHNINIHHNSHVIISFRIIASEEQAIIYRGDNTNKTIISSIKNTSNIGGLEFAKVYANSLITAITSYENGNTTLSYLG